jgi:hypothetical protein
VFLQHGLPCGVFAPLLVCMALNEAVFCMGEFDTPVWQDKDFHGDGFKLAVIVSVIQITYGILAKIC